MSAFTEAVEHYLDGLKHVGTGAIRHDCGECYQDDSLSDDDWSDSANEAGFSWSQCDGCGSTLGGSRHPAHGWTEINGREILVHLDICTDCLMYLANGDEPETWE